MPGRARSPVDVGTPGAADKDETESPPAAPPVGGLRSPAVSGKRLLWLGGLVAVAAVGVVEWPVALVVGVGTYVAERLTRDDVRRDLQRES